MTTHWWVVLLSQVIKCVSTDQPLQHTVGPDKSCCHSVTCHSRRTTATNVNVCKKISMTDVLVFIQPVAAALPRTSWQREKLKLRAVHASLHSATGPQTGHVHACMTLAPLDCMTHASLNCVIHTTCRPLLNVRLHEACALHVMRINLYKAPDAHCQSAT